LHAYWFSLFLGNSWPAPLGRKPEIVKVDRDRASKSRIDSMVAQSLLAATPLAPPTTRRADS